MVPHPPRGRLRGGLSGQGTTAPIRLIDNGDWRGSPCLATSPASARLAGRPSYRRPIIARTLIVLTSHGTLGRTERPTGFYFEELATPYWALRNAGHAVEIASGAGGAAVVDPGGLPADEARRPASVRRFLADPEATAALEDMAVVASLDADAYDAVMLPGGHGTMWDFAESEPLAALVSRVHARGGVVAAVCHGPAGLLGATRPDGHPFVEGLCVAAFTDAEEAAVGLADVVPFLLSSRLASLGARMQPGPDFTETAVSDGRLVTGLNPQSSGVVARLLV